MDGGGGWEGGRPPRRAWPHAIVAVAAVGLLVVLAGVGLAEGLGGWRLAGGGLTGGGLRDGRAAPAATGQGTQAGRLAVERGLSDSSPALPADGEPTSRAGVGIAGIPPPLPGDAGILLTRVDPRGLADQAGSVPAMLSGETALAASADGRLLAAVTMPAAGVARLHVFDTALWPRAGPVRVVEGPVEWLAFTPEDDAVAWLRATDPTVAPLDTRYRVERQRIHWPFDRTSTALPARLVPRAMRPLRGGRVAVVAATAGGVPAVLRVLVVDTDAMGVVADVAVKQGADLAALAWDVNRDRLYLAPPAQDRIVAVGLGAGGVGQHGDAGARVPAGVVADTALPPAAPPPGAVGFAVPAREDRIAGEAAVSPDGSLLYLVGQHDEREPDEANSGERRWRRPLGLRVVDAAALRVVGGLEQPVSAVTPTPDGRLVLLGTPSDGLLVVTPTLEQIATVEPGRQVQVLGFGAEGEVAYLRSHDGEGGRVAALNLLTLRISGERRADTDIDVLPAAAVLAVPQPR